MKAKNVPFTSVSVDPEIQKMRDMLTSTDDVFMDAEGTFFKERDEAGSGPGPKAKTAPHTIVSAKNDERSVQDMIDEMRGEETDYDTREQKRTAERNPEGTLEGKAVVAPKCIMSAPQWYKQHPELLKAEKDAMEDFQGKRAKFGILSDGRACWLVRCRPMIPGKSKAECRSYDIALIYDNDHPKSRCGSSVKAYLLKPTIYDLQEVVNRTPGVFPKKIPHLLTDEKEEFYLCSADPSNVHTDADSAEGITSAATSLRFALRWINIFELGLIDPFTWEKFQKHGEI